MPELPGLRGGGAGAWSPSWPGPGTAAGCRARPSGCCPAIRSRCARRHRRNEEQAVAAAARLGGRVALKAEAAAWCTRPRLARSSSTCAPRRMSPPPTETGRPVRAGLRRVLVQPMVTGGVEVLVGVVQEPVFGPLVVFGLGGVATDVLGDRAARLTPLTRSDAGEMIRDVRAAPLLLGHRGPAGRHRGPRRRAAARVAPGR